MTFAHFFQDGSYLYTVQAAARQSDESDCAVNTDFTLSHLWSCNCISATSLVLTRKCVCAECRANDCYCLFTLHHTVHETDKASQNIILLQIKDSRLIRNKIIFNRFELKLTDK